MKPSAFVVQLFGIRRVRPRRGRLCKRATPEGAASELLALQEKYAALLEETSFNKRRAQQLERENKRLQAIGAYIRQSKRQLAAQIASLEDALQKERRARALEASQPNAHIELEFETLRKGPPGPRTKLD